MLMPTNVTVEYAKAEMEYQKAKTPEEKLECLHEMLKQAPGHKGAETLRAEIKTKISKLKEKLIKEKEKKKSSGSSLHVKKEGAAQVMIIGSPNTGKSSLLNILTGAKTLIAKYPYSTVKPEVAVLDYQTVKIQLVDLPPIMEGASIKQTPLLSMVRNCDLILVVIDDLSQLNVILNELKESNILINKEKPAINIIRDFTGGLEIIGEKLIHADIDSVRKVLRSHGIANATIEIFSDVNLDDFFNVVDEKIAYVPALAVFNKKEYLKDINEINELNKIKNVEVINASIKNEINIQLIKERVWEHLKLIKVFTKEPGKPPTKKDPVTLNRGSSIKDMAQHIHKDFVKKFRYAKVWGKSAKHQGQTVGLEHKLDDDDVVGVHLK